MRSNNSVCTVTLSSNLTFLKFWLSDGARDGFLSNVEKEDLESLRLVCHDFSTRAARYLFKNIRISFKAGTFTKPARVAALERIGHHVQSLSCSISHTAETFLPPLIDPYTGEERNFIYTPQLNMPSTLIGKVKQPKYGSWEVADLLVKQYPPLFHAATNVPAFIRAFTALPNLSHLIVSCPGHDKAQDSRRSIVDYALISLRLAIEHAPLHHLDTLSFLPIHAAGLFYMQPVLGIGASPRSAKRWVQIRRIAIHMDGLESNFIRRSDYLKALHTYLRTFSLSLVELRFRWRDAKGPCPLSLASEPGACFEGAQYSPARNDSSPRALYFPQLRHMQLENAILDASQISSFISQHRRTLTEFNFEDVKLRTGDWDEALSPLSQISGSDKWKKKQEEIMDVPLMLSHENLGQEIVHNVALEQKPERRSRSWGGWLSKTRSGKACKAKEQLMGGSEHMRKLLRSSILTWR